MSYCRAYNSNNQVYLYGDVSGYFCCCGCLFMHQVKHSQHKSVFMASRSEAIAHLRAHRLAGHKFPRRAERNLMQELKEEGEFFKCSERKDTSLFGKSQSWEQYRNKQRESTIDFLKRVGEWKPREGESDDAFLKRHWIKTKKDLKKFFAELKK